MGSHDDEPMDLGLSGLLFSDKAYLFTDQSPEKKKEVLNYRVGCPITPCALLYPSLFIHHYDPLLLIHANQQNHFQY